MGAVPAGLGGPWPPPGAARPRRPLPAAPRLPRRTSHAADGIGLLNAPQAITGPSGAGLAGENPAGRGEGNRGAIVDWRARKQAARWREGSLVGRWPASCRPVPCAWARTRRPRSGRLGPGPDTPAPPRGSTAREGCHGHDRGGAVPSFDLKCWATACRGRRRLAEGASGADGVGRGRSGGRPAAVHPHGRRQQPPRAGDAVGAGPSRRRPGAWCGGDTARSCPVWAWQ
jgi:hypothetical protein